jgi:hypothetical protein
VRAQIRQPGQQPFNEGCWVEFQQVGRFFAFARAAHRQILLLRKGYGDAVFGRAIELGKFESVSISHG